MLPRRSLLLVSSGTPPLLAPRELNQLSKPRLRLSRGQLSPKFLGICRAEVAYGEISSGGLRLFTRLGGILAIGIGVPRHKRHNRNIPTSSDRSSQIAIRNLYIWLEWEPDFYVRSPGARPICRASSN